jgi:3-isopropylmalate/(R)-2-methylmalate dehydratase small subunit
LKSIIQGKAYVLGENIDTDQIIPAQHLVYDLDDPKERRLYGMYAFSGVPMEKAGLPGGYCPFIEEKRYTSEFVIVIAGKNFGCGSSREHAPVAMQMAGVRAVVSTSYARIFYRNAVDGGYILPLESQEDLSKIIETGDILKIDMLSNSLSHTSGDYYPLQTMGEAAKIINAGGIFAYARKNQLFK